MPYGFPDGEDATSHLNVRRINAKLSQIPFFVVVVVLSKRRAWNLRTASAQLWNEKQNKKTELAVSTYADDLLRHMLVYFPQHINNRSATCRTIVQWWCSTNFEILVKKNVCYTFFKQIIFLKKKKIKKWIIFRRRLNNERIHKIIILNVYMYVNIFYCSIKITINAYAPRIDLAPRVLK